MAELHILSWRDIPAQVVVEHDGHATTMALSRRFIEAIDRAALRDGIKLDADEGSEWRRSQPILCGSDDPAAEARAAAARIEQNYDPKMLAELSAAGGRTAARQR